MKSNTSNGAINVISMVKNLVIIDVQRIKEKMTMKYE